ncbi:MAG: MerR family transcriptional regulator [Clostridia bacterium]|nr:MerR family transcriptional regulator [Clostridia bacterium]
MKYNVKQMAQMTGLSEHTIRFYTDKELLPCQRDEKGRRVFDDESINWFRGIQCLRSCGVSLEGIKVYSNLCMSDEDDAMVKRYEFMAAQRQVAYERLKEAQALVEYMDKKVAHYEDILAGKLEDDTRMADFKPECCK